MIRVLVALLAVMVFAILLLTPWSRKQKIVSASFLFLCGVALVWFDSARHAIHSGLVNVQEIEICNQQVQFSYRSNYDFTLCLKNTADDATVKRIALQFTAQECIEQRCESVETIDKSVPFTLLPDQREELKINLAFDKVADSVTNPTWQITITEVWAH